MKHGWRADLTVGNLVVIFTDDTVETSFQIEEVHISEF